jgi:ethanolamine ammonia-lyase small subunit
MPDDHDGLAPSGELPEVVRKVRARTPARLLVGRAGGAYRTNTQIELREAHAAARDAVRAAFHPLQLFGSDFVNRWTLLETRTKATNKDEYLLRPDLGRQFDDASRAELQNCPKNADLQIAIGDGLSVTAVAAQVPPLLELLCEAARQRGWTLGRVLAIHHCRVGLLNEIGELLKPEVAVLLIGERPGLATAESLSAYMAYRPGDANTDANRNVISNIHRRGLSPQEAAARILDLAERMKNSRTSGCQLKEGSTELDNSSY